MKMDQSRFAELVENLRTQDGRMTHYPMYMVTLDARVPTVEKYAESEAWFTDDGHVLDDLEEYLRECGEEPPTQEEDEYGFVERAGTKYIRRYFRREPRCISVHLTQASADRYINCRQRDYEWRLYVYVDSAHNWGELGELADAIKDGLVAWKGNV